MGKENKSHECPAVTVEGVLRDVSEGNETVLEVLEAMTDGDGKGSKLVVSRRQLQPEQPSLAPLERSPAPAHVFHTVESVQDYLEQYGNEKTVIVADANSQLATIVLDEQSVLGGVVELKFRPALHPVFQMWNAYFSKPRPVLQFAQFAMENRRGIVEPDGKELVLVMSQLTMSKHVEVAKGRGPNSINGVMVTVDIGGSKQDTPVALPDMVTIETPMFLTGDKVRVQFDLLVYESNGEIMVSGSNPELNAELADRFIQDVQRFQEELNGPVVTFGVSGYEPLSTID